MASRRMNTGVYVIEHIASGRLYVGSAANIGHRWKTHLFQLRDDRHHSKHMQRCWNKYGEEAFRFRIVLLCDRHNLLSYEQALIDAWKPAFNSAPTAGSQLGYKHRPETKAKMSASSNRTGNPGYRHSEESKRQISENRKGKGGGPRTKERLAKISAALKGRQCPMDRRARISLALTGKKQSAETIEKRVQKLRGRKMPDGFGAAVSARMTGKKPSPSVVEKIARKRAKLTDEQVRCARKRLACGDLQRVIAAEFKVDQSVISEINSGKSYRWVI